jgi:hypothetical protein
LSKKKKSAVDVPWTPFQPASLSREDLARVRACEGVEPARGLVNSRYEVWIYEWPDGDRPEGPPVLQLSIKRRDRSPVRRWRDLQRIKNECAGPLTEGCELFPSESRLVDTSNQFHIWCLPAGLRFPFGYRDRPVMEGNGEKSWQDPFPEGERPDDCIEAPRTDDGMLEMASRLRQGATAGRSKS